MYRKIFSSGLLLLSTVFGAVATAQDGDDPTGPYLGAAATRSRFDSVNVTSYVNVDDQDNSWKVIGGWRLHENFAVEASYVDFGGASALIVANNPITRSREAKGLSAFAVGMLPLGRVELFGKVGLASIDSKDSFSGGQNSSTSDTTTEFAYGAGAQFRFHGLRFRAEYEKFETEFMGGLELISLGATYTFGGSGFAARARNTDVVSGPYVGATISQSRFTDESFSGFGVNYDHSSKVLAGWRLHQNFAIEASYFTLGDIASLVGNSSSFSVEPKGYGVSAIGLLPVGHADFFAKAGAISIDWNSRVAPLTTRFSLDSENGTKLAYGAGVQLRFGGVAVRAEYERFDTDVFRTRDIELVSLGATYTFNLGK